MNIRRAILAVALSAVTGAGVAAAGEPATVPGSTATAMFDAPMFYMKDADRTPIRIVSSGEQVRVVGKEGRWLRVVYRDARYGEEAGYMKASSLRLQGEEWAPGGGSGALRQRGFVDVRLGGFAQEALNDPQQFVSDTLIREEIRLKPSRSFELAGGIDLRSNSYGQVEDEWRLDLENRGSLRPRAVLRRLSATVNAGRFSLEAGNQFVRWGKADIVNPTDRFAPRDYLTVVNSDVLPVLGARATLQLGDETLEAVYVPRMTPSRMPLLNQRWTVLPSEAQGLTPVDQGAVFPTRSQQGVRWNHTGSVFEASASFFDGVNHLPDIAASVDPTAGVLNVARSYPELRTYGADLTIPTSVVTLKGEAAWFTSPSSTAEEYVLYVVELERQVGEWLLDGGYAGEVVTEAKPGLSFNPERGLTSSFIGRAALTVDPRKTLSIEGAVRRSLSGVYIKGEYSQAFGQHLRMTLGGVAIGGDDDDFIGQYRRNSHVTLDLRVSF